MHIEHAHFCQPRPGEDEVRTETFQLPRYDESGVVVTSMATIHRCMECGEQTVTG